MEQTSDAQKVVDSLLSQISVLSQEKAMLLAQIHLLTADKEADDGGNELPADEL